MLKKIAVTDLRMGMHLHALDGAWLDHPFWRNKFLLTDDADLRAVLGSGVRHCWIDAAKGLDVAIAAAPVAEPVALAEPMASAPERVPDDVWSTRRTVILHPGPLGDRGPSSLDWAISDGEQEWGVTALSAIRHPICSDPSARLRRGSLPAARNQPGTGLVSLRATNLKRSASSACSIALDASASAPSGTFAMMSKRSSSSQFGPPTTRSDVVP